MSDDVTLSVRHAVATITLNRPKNLNALTIPMFYELVDMLKRLTADDEVGALVITGAGRSFCAGGDVKSMGGFYDRPMNEVVQSMRDVAEMTRRLSTFPKPTLAMISGHAFGGGLCILSACDIRIASEEAQFSTAYSKIGLSGDIGGTYYLSRLVGVARARELYLTSETFRAAEAFQWGLLSRVVPLSDLQPVTYALAERLANGPRKALSMIKENFAAVETGSASEVFEIEMFHHMLSHDLDDHKEAVRAFAEKRQPSFKNKPKHES